MVLHLKGKARRPRSVNQQTQLAKVHASNKRKLDEQTHPHPQIENACMQEPEQSELSLSLSSMQVESMIIQKHETFEKHPDITESLQHSEYRSAKHRDVQFEDFSLLRKKRSLRDHLYSRDCRADLSNGNMSPDEQSVTLLGKCKTLQPQSKMIIRNVHKYLLKLQKQEVIVDAEKSLIDATGICRSSLKKVLKETYHLQTLKKKHAQKRHRTTFSKVDSFDLDVIRRIFHRFFTKQEHISLRKLLDIVKQEIHFPYGYSTFRKIIRKIGFKYRKRNNRLFVYERKDIMQARKDYIIKIREFRKQGRPIFYQDETWCNEGYTKQRAWYDTGIEKNPHDALTPGSDLSLGYKDPLGKGKRLIISHVGGSGGFIEGAEEVFKSNKTSDYHEEMNGDHFEKWFADVLIPRLPQNVVIVLDNAPYHTRQVDKAPTSVDRKGEIVAWLDKHAIHHNKSSKKADLYKIVLQHKTQHKQFKVDAYAAQRGFTILRLPQYHCELNPIELIWAQVKHFIATRNTTHKIADVERLVHDAFKSVSCDNWKKAIEHVIKIENDYMQKMNSYNSNDITQIIISVQSDESDSETF